LGVNETLEKKEEDMRKGDVILFVSRVTANNEVREALKDALKNKNEALAEFENKYHYTTLDATNDYKKFWRVRKIVNNLITIATSYLQIKHKNNSEIYENEAAKLTLATVVKCEIYNEYQEVLYYLNKYDACLYFSVAALFQLFAEIEENEELSRFANRLYEIASQVNSMPNSYFTQLYEIEDVDNACTLQQVNMFALVVSKATKSSVSKIFSVLTQKNIEEISGLRSLTFTNETYKLIENFTPLAIEVARKC